MIRWTVALTFCLGVVLSSASVGAQEPVRVIVDYVAPAECPPAVVFQSDVAHRLPDDRTIKLESIQEPVTGTLGLRVRVSKTSGGYRAELTTVTEEGRSSPRHLEGPVCAELMDAMAFTAALTVDPNATSAPTEPAVGEATRRQSAGSPERDAAARSAEPAFSPRETPTERRTAPPANDPLEEPIPVPAPVHVPMWATSLSVGVLLTAPVSPGVSPGLLAVVRYSDEAPGPWSPAVAVGVIGWRLVSSYSPNASFDAAGAHFEFCPSSIRDHSITIRPCATGQLSIVTASGVNLTHNSRVTVALPSLGAHIELRHALTPHWFLTGIAGAQLTLQRHRFEAGLPPAELASTRPVAPLAGLQIGSFLP